MATAFSRPLFKGVVTSIHPLGPPSLLGRPPPTESWNPRRTSGPIASPQVHGLQYVPYVPFIGRLNWLIIAASALATVVELRGGNDTKVEDVTAIRDEKKNKVRIWL